MLQHRQRHEVVPDAQTQLKICSFDCKFCGQDQDPKSYKEFMYDKFTFYAFNLSTGQSLPVTMHGNALFVSTLDINFSQISEQEEVLVRKLQEIIDRPFAIVTQPAKRSAHQFAPNLAQQFRMGLQNVLHLYSAASVPDTRTKSVVASAEEYARARRYTNHTKQAAQRPATHENSFIEITFSILNKPAFSNSFAAIVPISDKNGKLAALLPYNGSMWEKRIADTRDDFIKSHIVP